MTKSIDEYEIIFVTRFRHWRTGKIIVARPGSAFPLKVRKK